MRPAILPSIPRPGTARVSSAAIAPMPAACALATIARASGCEDRASSAAATSSNSCSDASFSGSTAATSGSPMVIVPVLSMASAVIRPGAST